jgi:hypothetical protein
MLNINFSKKELAQLKERGYYVEHEKDIITVRDIQGKAVGEIVSLGEGSNSVILMSKTQVYWCKSIDGIHEYLGYVYVNIRPIEGGIGQIRLY